MGIGSKRPLITRQLTPDSWLKRLVQGFPSSHHLRVQPRKPRQRHRVEIDPHLRFCRSISSSGSSTSSSIYCQTFPSPATNSLLLLPPSSTFHPHFFYSLKNITIMSLSNKLSITDVDVKGKKVLIRVSTLQTAKVAD
jgi:hypothetical protein